MASIRARKDNKKLFFDFTYHGTRCREQTALVDNQANRRKLEKVLAKIEAEIMLNSFDYANYFPNSKLASLFTGQAQQADCRNSTPLFAEFATNWLEEMKAQWRESHNRTIVDIFVKYLMPSFGRLEIGTITRRDIFEFRAELAKQPGRTGKTLSPSRINHIMAPLRMVLAEAAIRYDFASPFNAVKPLKLSRIDIEPFTLEEVRFLLEHIRADYKNYLKVRFFTAMRSSEINGLRWENVDFDRRQILVREALVRGKMSYVKNDSSFRAIEITSPVMQALQDQRRVTGQGDFVFTSRAGSPIDNSNFTQRVWYPLLRHLGLKKRKPYQTRHTTATLWLASGESPEWIAAQMGHSTTTMLFRVYSRFIPNLTRQDGSAFERVLKQADFV